MCIVEAKFWLHGIQEIYPKKIVVSASLGRIFCCKVLRSSVD
jgi:hypothetical protein